MAQIPETAIRQKHTGLVAPTDSIDRAIKAVLLSQAVDAVGDVIIASEVKWARFRRNPKMLREHAHRDDIGTWDPESLTLTTLEGSPAWTATGRLYPAGVSASADDTYARLQAGSMGVSVGFFVGTAEPRPGGRGQVLRGVEIIEASLVNVPACPHCVVVSKALHSPVDPPLVLDMKTLRMAIKAELEAAVDRATPHIERGLQRALLKLRGRVD